MQGKQIHHVCVFENQLSPPEECVSGLASVCTGLHMGKKKEEAIYVMCSV